MIYICFVIKKAYFGIIFIAKWGWWIYVGTFVKISTDICDPRVHGDDFQIRHVWHRKWNRHAQLWFSRLFRSLSKYTFALEKQKSVSLSLIHLWVFKQQGISNSQMWINLMDKERNRKSLHPLYFSKNYRNLKKMNLCGLLINY